ncbi:MAG: hypothetical protein GXX79_13785 [Actinomycetales bacterium]|nr:hypothetical protein [Actinomycetales bacterium]
MIFRLSLAYGAIQAALASAAMILLLVLLGRHMIGVTRQPLPLSWPLSVTLVVASQVPLRNALDPLERVAAKAPVMRALRAAFSLLVLALTAAASLVASVDPALLVFIALLAALGFTSVALTGTEPWLWTLPAGMTWVGLQFITPLGTQMASLLSIVPVPVAIVSPILAAALYTVNDRRA